MSYGLDNLPYASVVDRHSGRRFVAVRHGHAVVDLTALDAELFGTGTMDALLASDPTVWTQVRRAAHDLVATEATAPAPLTGVDPVLGFTVADYVDFYASEHHATNAGRILRPHGEALPPNWHHLPIGYHGRSGSVVASGAPVRRPHGVLAPGEFGPTQRLDFEAEVAFVVGGAPATRIDVADADRHVFGVCLLDDWSARDIQAFEAAPLGPFLGKSFATSVSPWITPLAALDTARTVTAATDQPPHLPVDVVQQSLDISLTVSINGTVVSRPEFVDMRWTYGQLLAHLTSNGAVARPGDVFASGTVSGPEREQRGCLLELTWNGTEPISLADGTERAWLHDGDEVTVSGTAGDITLGDVSGRIVAADPLTGD